MFLMDVEAHGKLICGKYTIILRKLCGEYGS